PSARGLVQERLLAARAQALEVLEDLLFRARSEALHVAHPSRARGRLQVGEAGHAQRAVQGADLREAQDLAQLDHTRRQALAQPLELRAATRARQLRDGGG